MNLHLCIIPHTLQFKFNARTSRGAMQQHQVFYLELLDKNKPETTGIGECAPLPGLSPEHQPGFFNTLQNIVNSLNHQFAFTNIPDLKAIIYNNNLERYPSIAFALETAWLDLQSGGRKLIFNNLFSAGERGIPINGLIWMGDKVFMQEQIKAKLKEGYSCLKLKIGGLDFDSELQIIKSVRQVAASSDLTIRLDANGAFSPAGALGKLTQLAAYHIHSIEQPIRQNQPEAMHRLCRESPISIALDEELIGISEKENKRHLLAAIQPQYIILKPTLAGGLQACAEWIALAEENNIGWWMTSALESNIALNAISQFTAQYSLTREQGLGTGQLYHNNIASPLTIKKGYLYYHTDKPWDDITNIVK